MNELVMLAGLDEAAAAAFRLYRGPLARRCVVVHDDETLFTYCSDAVVAAVVLGSGLDRPGEAAGWLAGRQTDLVLVLIGEVVDAPSSAAVVDDLNMAFEHLESRLSS